MKMCFQGVNEFCSEFCGSPKVLLMPNELTPHASCWHPPLSLFLPSLVGGTREVGGNHTTSPKAIKTQMVSLCKQEADKQGLLLHPLNFFSLLHGYFLSYVFIYFFSQNNIYAARGVMSAPLLFLTNSWASKVHRKHPGFAHEPLVFGTESTAAHWEVGTEMTYQVINLCLKPGKKLLGWFELGT